MKTIEEKNRMIAEFMGVKPNEYGVYDFGNEQKWSELKYHTSWDWLMPVVEKIEDIRVQPDEEEFISYHRFTVDMPCSQCEIVDTESGKVVASGDGATKLASTYTAVVNFIEWYNKTNN